MKPITLCMVGLNFGSYIIEHELLMGKHPLISLVGVCDLQKEKVDYWSKSLGITGYYSLEEALANPTIDAIGLFSGPIGRADLIDQIISAGKHVMTTKPFESSSKKAQEVLEKAEHLGMVVHLNSPSATPSEDMQQVYAWRDSYDLGRPIGLRASVWCNYRETPDGSWYDDPSLCPAAPIVRLGVYLLNDLIPLFGSVKDLQVMESRLFTERPTADNAQLSLLFENGAIGAVYASFCVEDGQYYRNAFELNFERGTITRNLGAYARVEGQPCRLGLSTLKDNRQLVLHKELTTQSSGYQWENFIRAIRGETLPYATTSQQIVDTVRVLERLTTP